ncbi:MAG: glycosyltransferase [Bacteroidales bacterium]|nr:glycosyltransferase [Bacteroidales bacterium]
MEKPRASVIISVYNNFKFLELVLAGFERQTNKNFEILLADDGSEEEFIKKTQYYINHSSLNIRHVWHEDKGWRKNAILNNAIQTAGSDYLIFIDGDCIPHKNFAHEHLLNRDHNTILAGRRSNLSQFISDKLTFKNVKNGILERGFALTGLFLKSIVGGTHLENAVYFKSNFIRKRINKKDKGVLGSNFSLYKSDILEINGFDERYLKPAVGEDTDLEYRLRNAGKKVKSIKHLAIQYHLFHKKLERDKANLEYLNQVIENKTTYTPYGINK